MHEGETTDRSPTDREEIQKGGYGDVGNKRYVRVVVNVTGSHTNGTPLGIAAVYELLESPAR